jgi:hypothetical protein
MKGIAPDALADSVLTAVNGEPIDEPGALSTVCH